MSSSDKRIRIGPTRPLDFLADNDLRQVFEIHLVDDAGGGWHDAEMVEGFHSPAQELIALAIALEFQFGIATERLL